MLTYTRESSVGARRLYERLGYQVVEYINDLGL